MALGGATPTDIKRQQRSLRSKRLQLYGNSPAAVNAPSLGAPVGSPQHSAVTGVGDTMFSGGQLPEGVGTGLQQLVGAYNQSFQEANAANESRYQKLLQLSGRTERRTSIARRESLRQAKAEESRNRRLGQEGMRDISRTTGQRKRDIRESGREEQIRQQALLQRQGLGGTTVGITAGRGVRSETQSQLDRLADLMRGRRQGVRSEIAGRRERSQAGIQGLREQIAQQTPAARLGIMERRTDTGPDFGALSQLFGNIGEGFGGQGISEVIKALTNLQQ